VKRREQKFCSTLSIYISKFKFGKTQTIEKRNMRCKKDLENKCD
jgi:hypothetical protein